MDFRDYDPAIARWTGIDPVVHYSQSTYNAFDGNPVFWADPSGADSSSGGFSTDVFGRERFDDNGIYIPFGERVGSNFENYFKDESISEDGGGGINNETWSQQKFRDFLTWFVTSLDDVNDGNLSIMNKDNKVNAYELFYQWVMGTGSSTRNFDENSTMGKQMLKAPEVLEAINKAINTGKTTDFSRSLKKENVIAYVKSFYKDVDGRNPARGFHGSYAGQVKVSVSTYGNIAVTNLTIIITDKMTATSGTRASGTVGGYDANPLAIYPKENPYGPNGQFRTIIVNYNMKISITKKINN